MDSTDGRSTSDGVEGLSERLSMSRRVEFPTELLVRWTTLHDLQQNCVGENFQWTVFRRFSEHFANILFLFIGFGDPEEIPSILFTIDNSAFYTRSFIFV